jgi:phosphohistidine phosphatase
MIGGAVDHAAVVSAADDCHPVSVELYLMRHGDAQDATRDRDRPLSAKGRAQARSSALGLRHLRAMPSVLWHSPYLRAAQTAAIAAEVLGLTGGAIVEDDRLTPDGDADAVARWLLADRRAGLVVAHMPILPSLVLALTGGAATFTTAGVAHLTVVGGHAVLSGLYSATALEHMS